MKIFEYQYIHSLDSGATDYEFKIIEYLKIDQSQSWDKVKKDIEDHLKINPREIRHKYLKIGRRIFKIQKEFLQSSFEQFVRLDMLLAEEDNVKNLHKLLAIYVRPLFSKFNLKTQDKIENYLLNLDMSIAQGLIVFFSLNATKSLRNINISYLNQMKETSTKGSTKSK